jgi:hypothetical protein
MLSELRAGTWRIDDNPSGVLALLVVTTAIVTASFKIRNMGAAFNMSLLTVLTALMAFAESGHPSQVMDGARASYPAPTANYTVAIYYWPNFHRDDYHQSKKGDGWTEWEIVKNGVPKFPGHHQPKVPLWGYRDESDPQEMARSIGAMADAGIGAIIFDWYRYDDEINGGEMIEKALREGFLKAANRDRVKFALMWANHTYIDCHPFAPGVSFGNAPVWRKGEVDRAAFERHTQDAIESYFKQPNYWTIDGRPYFSIYDLEKLLRGLGGLAQTRAALDDFRARVKAAGFPDLHLNVVDQSLIGNALELVRGQPSPDDPARKIETIAELLAALKVDSSTMYTWAHHLYPMLLEKPEKSGATPAAKTFGFADDPAARPVASKTAQHSGGATDASTLLERAAKAGVVAVDYAEYGRRALQLLDERPEALQVTYFPHVSMGWDGSPRNYSMGLVLNNAPQKWGEFLRETRAWLDRHPESRGIVTLNSWNEWVEGSYIEPDTVNGMKYLEAVREAFSSGNVGSLTEATDTASHAVLEGGRIMGEKATVHRYQKLRSGATKTGQGWNVRDFASSFFNPNPEEVTVTMKMVSDDPEFVFSNGQTGTYTKAYKLRPMQGETDNFYIGSTAFGKPEWPVSPNTNFTGCVEFSGTKPFYCYLLRETECGEAPDATDAYFAAWKTWRDEVPAAWDGDLGQFVIPYTNYWHNEKIWPVGWHSVLTLKNGSDRSVTYTLRHIPYYGGQFDPKNGQVTRYQEQSADITLEKGEEKAITLQDLFGWDANQMSSMEGCLLIIPRPRETQTRTVIRFSVVPNTSGERLHDAIR